MKVLDAKCLRSHDFILGMLSSVALNGRKGGAGGGLDLAGQLHAGASALAAATQSPHDGPSLEPGNGKCSLMIFRSCMASQLM